MTIRNLKDNSKKPWLCECYPQGRNGKRIRKKFATKGEATAFENYTMSEIKDKPWLGEKEDNRHLSELIDLWYQYHGKTLTSGARTYYRLNVLAELLHDPIARKFEAKDWIAFCSIRKSSGNGKTELSIKTNDMDKRFISAVLNYCISINEWNYPNPLRNLKSAKAQESEMYFLTTKEIEILLLHIKTTCRKPELYLKIIKICLSTGARIREVTSLRGSQISKYRITYTKTKGKKNRSVPISKELYDYIYQDTSAELFYDCTKGIAAMIKKLFPHLPRGQATHVLRHTFASHFMMNGGNLLVLRQILGHASVNQTMVYAHLSPTHLEDAVSKNPLVGIEI